MDAKTKLPLKLAFNLTRDDIAAFEHLPREFSRVDLSVRDGRPARTFGRRVVPLRAFHSVDDMRIRRFIRNAVAPRRRRRVNEDLSRAI
jgi:hypothetical protein